MIQQPCDLATAPRFREFGWYRPHPGVRPFAVSLYQRLDVVVLVPLTQFVIDCPHQFHPGERYGRMV